ncbi:type II toxin-antitoxin system RelE family toxin [Salegentibacter holothuriorum]|uniref:type II toxin-antitoxin system RelE family toxin n=1 Tax=Salegentibacter holothuriorum TaxID=241145 RepID=UPI0009A68031
MEQLQNTENLSQQPIKKLKGFKDFYRIRIGDYRLGVKKLTDQEILLVRFLQRKEIYKYFPKRD